uniref:Uncharacterized protein n=1 Tax=Anguilla anguilla TaxID=7936 RepID=A0A0E9VGD7_ANGAN
MLHSLLHNGCYCTCLVKNTNTWGLIKT